MTYEISRLRKLAGLNESVDDYTDNLDGIAKLIRNLAARSMQGDVEAVIDDLLLTIKRQRTNEQQAQIDNQKGSQ